MSIDASNSAAAAAADKVRAAVEAQLSGMVGYGPIAKNVAAAIGALAWFIGVLPAMLFGAIFRVAAEVTALFLEGIDEVRNANQDVLNSVAAASLTDILGVKVSSADMPSKDDTSGNAGKGTGMGGKVLDAITQQMGGTVSSNPGRGERAARGFMGFGLNFAVNAGMLSFIAEIEALGFIKGFKEIPEEIRGAMGIGRLMRLALQPIIHALVTVPYTRECNQLYRPTQLSPAEYVRAFNSGRMEEAEVRSQLGQHGYSDAYITEILAQLAPRISAKEVDALVRWGQLDQERGLEVLTAEGLPVGVARNRLLALHLERADAQEHAYAGEILKLAQQREIDSETFSTLMQRLHMPQEEMQGYLNRLGVYLDSHTKQLTIGEVLYLAERNLITIADVDKWITAQGYNADTHSMLDTWITSKELDFDAAQKAKAAKLAAAAAKANAKKPPPATKTPAGG